MHLQQITYGQRDFLISQDDLQGADDELIPLYELDGNRRSRVAAWRDGVPSDIERGKARELAGN